MENPCIKCRWSDECDRKYTPFVRDIVSRGHARCANYEPMTKKQQKEIEK